MELVELIEIIMIPTAIIIFVSVVVGLILFFSPIIIIWQLSKISAASQEMNEKMFYLVRNTIKENKDKDEKAP